MQNDSHYVTFKHSTMPEWEFVREVAKQAGCRLLLDINKVYVNAKNHGFSAEAYLHSIPSDLVGQIHLDGHTDKGKFIFDTHSSPVIEEVWDLYRLALERWGTKPTLIEWDEDIPPFERLVEEAQKARRIYELAPSPCSSPPQKGERIGEGVRPPSMDTSIPSLREIELHLRDVIEKGPEEPQKKSWLEAVLNPQGGESPAVRIQVYREGYAARTRGTLLEMYPAIARVLGEEVFGGAAEGYAHAYPSHHYNLNLKGASFAEFLSASP